MVYMQLYTWIFLFQLEITFKPKPEPVSKKLVKKSDVVKPSILLVNPDHVIHPDVCLSVYLDLQMSSGSHINEEAPSSWIVYLGGKVVSYTYIRRKKPTHSK